MISVSLSLIKTILETFCPPSTLSLEANPLPEHSFHLLLGPGST